MQTPTPTAIIAEAFAASTAAGLAQFERDGQRDRGSCGGYLLAIDGRSPVAKALLAAKRGYRSDPGVMVIFPDGDCPSQHAAIRIEAGKAARTVFEAHGVRVVEARAYVD